MENKKPEIEKVVHSLFDILLCNQDKIKIVVMESFTGIENHKAVQHRQCTSTNSNVLGTTGER